jgi:type I restriction enzyme S subunit
VTGWSTRAIRTLVNASPNAKQLTSDTDVWNLNLDQIESHGGRVLEKEYVSAEKLGPSTFAFEPRTVLYSKLRPYLNKVVVADEAGFATTELVPLRCNPDEVHPEYLAYFLRSDEFLRFATEVVAGAKMPRMVMSEFWNFQVPVPPLPEQRCIAAILDQADALRAKRREALAQLDNLTQSIFIEMFGDPVKNERGWPIKRFGDVGTLDRGVSKHRPRNAPELLGGVHPLVQTGEVSNCDGYIRDFTHTYSDLGLKQSKIWPAGTLCITIAANIAKTGILTFDACFPDSVVGFRADDPATVEFVRVWLSFLQKALEDSAPESAQKNINLAILRGLNIPAPPLVLQQTFATRIQSVEALKARHREALQELDLLFASLQHRAFQGNL